MPKPEPGTCASPAPRKTDRAQLLAELRARPPVDVLVIGGGATGLGVALDAALRGLSVVLLESHDFAGGTSSRASKLVHGGVRYLAQGNIHLVREALRERMALLRNAPHLARPLSFVMPAYRYWQLPFYGLGLKAYDALAGRAGLGPTRFLNRSRVQDALPGVRTEGLLGGVEYWDGQFDDARLALALARSAAAQGALLLNYCPVTGLLHDDGKVAGVECRDAFGDSTFRIRASCVINATGVWADTLPGRGIASRRGTTPAVTPSRGIHIVVDQAFASHHHALLVPHTRDGRVMFAIPWMGRTLLGTTDTPCRDPEREPRPSAAELNFLLDESRRVLEHPPGRGDIRSIWAGLRPLVSPPARKSGGTKAISREHSVSVDPDGLLTVAGGKWTTYRAMAEDVLDRCVSSGLLAPLPACRTAHFPLIGAPSGGAKAGRDLTDVPDLCAYGSEAGWVGTLPGAETWLAPGLSEAMVRFAARHEYALTVEDVLARRSRILFLDAVRALDLAPDVARILRNELKTDPKESEFVSMAQQYLSLPS